MPKTKANDGDDIFKTIFDSLDQDKDGKVNKKELISRLRQSPQAQKQMDLRKGNTTKNDCTFDRAFKEITGSACTHITYAMFIENIGVIHFLLLDQEQKELAGATTAPTAVGKAKR